MFGGGRRVEDVCSAAVAVWPSGADGAVEAGDCRPVVTAAGGEGVVVRWEGPAGAEAVAVWLCNWWKGRERLPNPLVVVPLCGRRLRYWLWGWLSGRSGRRLWGGPLLENEVAWIPVEVMCMEEELCGDVVHVVEVAVVLETGL